MRKCVNNIITSSFTVTFLLRHIKALLIIFILLSSCTFAQVRKTIAGKITDQTGAPIIKAQVFLTNNSSLVSQTLTDDNGQFAFVLVILNANFLEVRADGFATYKQKIDFTENEKINLNIVLAPQVVSEEVVVTASRTETLLSDTAASVVVLSKNEIETTAALTLDDVLRQAVGFQLFRRSSSRVSNPTTQGVSLRGVGASGASRAIVLVDGIPLNDPFGGWINWNFVPGQSISRVEILRGGASALYGSGALGGAINVITRKEESPTLSLEGSFGNQMTPYASLFTSGQKKNWRASLAAESFRTDGYILVDETERGQVDTPAGSRHNTISFTLERQLNESSNIFVRGNYFGESRENGTSLTTNRTHLRQLIFGGDWQEKRAGNFTFRAYSSAQIYDQNFSSVSADRNSETLVRLQRVPSQVTGITAQWSRSFGARHTLIAGFDGREVRGFSNEIVFVNNRATSFSDAGGRERTTGVFVRDLIQLNSKLFFAGGVRFDHWRNYDAFANTRPVNSSTQTVRRFNNRNESALSPQVSVLYKPTINLSFAASAYRAFRAPTLNELYRSFRVGDVLTLANENLRAERLTGGEAGANVSSNNNRFTARGTFFWAEVNRSVANVTLSITPSLITRQRQNLARTRSRGLELEAEARFTKNLTGSIGYLFTDSVVIRATANPAFEGTRIPQVPRHQLTYQLRYVADKNWSAGLQGRNIGAQFDDDQNLFRLERYFTLDVFASKHINRNFTAFIAAENLFDKKYAVGRTPILTLGSPRLVRVGFRLELGER